MLDINPSLLVLVAAIFIFLIVVLNNILYKPLLDFMRERDESIEKDSIEARKNSNNVSHLEEEANKIIVEAKTKAHKMKEDAISNAKVEIESKIDAKKKELEIAYSKVLAELEQERDELAAGLAESLPKLNSAFKNKLSQI